MSVEAFHPKPCGLIYLITNIVNGKVYVGQTTKTIGERFSEHKSEARRGSELPFHRAVRKYKPDAFTATELEKCSDRDSLNQAETRWIRTLHAATSESGYNCTSGGEGGYERTPESRLRIAAAQTRYLEAHPEETLRLGAQSKLYNGSPQGRALHSELQRTAWARPEARGRLTEGQRKRCTTIEGRTHILAVGAKGRVGSVAHYDALRGGAWASEEVVRGLIQGVTVKAYKALRKKHPTLPKQPEFPRLYGKTYKEVRDGVRRKESAFDVARKGASKCV